MATLVLDRSDLEVRTDGAALALYECGERRGTVPIKLLERVIFQGDVHISAGVFGKLAESGVTMLMLSKRHSRRLAIVLGPAHNDAAVRIAQSRLVQDAEWCARWARRQVIGKLRGQLRTLRTMLEQRADCRKPLIDGIADIEYVMQGLTAGDACPLPDSVRGSEGAAARGYFKALPAVFPPALGFAGRNRRPPRDPVNACLSLGYTLLHFEAVRAAHMAGLDPLLGFYHRPAFGRESLASDLIEPLRPRMDEWVWTLFRERALRAESFSNDKGACLLGKAGREVFYQSFERFVPPARRALRRQCRVLAAHFRLQGSGFLTEDDDDEVGA